MATEVIELGEDGDAWIVTGVTGTTRSERYKNAKAAIDAWLELSLEGSDLTYARVTLAYAKTRSFVGWFATGHREGELVDSYEVEPPRPFVGVLVR